MMETQELVPCDKCYVLLRDMDKDLEVCGCVLVCLVCWSRYGSCLYCMLHCILYLRSIILYCVWSVCIRYSSSACKVLCMYVC